MGQELESRILEKRHFNHENHFFVRGKHNQFVRKKVAERMSASHIT